MCRIFHSPVKRKMSKFEMNEKIELEFARAMEKFNLDESLKDKYKNEFTLEKKIKFLHNLNLAEERKKLLKIYVESLRTEFVKDTFQRIRGVLMYNTKSIFITFRRLKGPELFLDFIAKNLFKTSDKIKCSTSFDKEELIKEIYLLIIFILQNNPVSIQDFPLKKMIVNIHRIENYENILFELLNCYMNIDIQSLEVLFDSRDNSNHFCLINTYFYKFFKNNKEKRILFTLKNEQSFEDRISYALFLMDLNEFNKEQNIHIDIEDNKPLNNSQNEQITADTNIGAEFVRLSKNSQNEQITADTNIGAEFVRLGKNSQNEQITADTNIGAEFVRLSKNYQNEQITADTNIGAEFVRLSINSTIEQKKENFTPAKKYQDSLMINTESLAEQNKEILNNKMETYSYFDKEFIYQRINQLLFLTEKSKILHFVPCTIENLLFSSKNSRKELMKHINSNKDQQNNIYTIIKENQDLKNIINKLMKENETLNKELKNQKNTNLNNNVNTHGQVHEQIAKKDETGILKSSNTINGLSNDLLMPQKHSIQNDVFQTYENINLENLQILPSDLKMHSVDNDSLNNKSTAQKINSTLPKPPAFKRGPPTMKKKIEKESEMMKHCKKFFSKEYVPLRWEKTMINTGLWEYIHKDINFEYLSNIIDLTELEPFEKTIKSESIALNKFIVKKSAFETKKADAIEIALAAQSIEQEEIINNILNLKTKKITESFVGILIKNFPSRNEIMLLKGFKQTDKLNPADSFYMKIMNNIEKFERNLNIIYFNLIFPYLYKSTYKYIISLTKTYNVLLKNESLKEFLQICLFFGNIINAKTPLGNANGFKLESLDKIIDYKGKNGVLLLSLVKSKMKTDLEENMQNIITQNIKYETITAEINELKSAFIKIGCKDTEDVKIHIADNKKKYEKILEEYNELSELHKKVNGFFNHIDSINIFCQLMIAYKRC